METHKLYTKTFLPFGVPRASVAVPIPKAIMNVHERFMTLCIICAIQDVAKSVTKIILTAFDGR